MGEQAGQFTPAGAVNILGAMTALIFSTKERIKKILLEEINVISLKETDRKSVV